VSESVLLVPYPCHWFSPPLTRRVLSLL
jgi:hypothetical protein